MNKRLLTPVLLAVSLMMTLLVAYFVTSPSRTVLDAKGVGVNNASAYFNMAMNGFVADTLGVEKKRILSYDDGPALKPAEENFKEEQTDDKNVRKGTIYTYEDETISVRVWKENFKSKLWGTEYTSEAAFADVKIADASQFRRGWAGSPSRPGSDAPTAIFNKNNGVVGMSSDYFTYRKYGYEYQYGKKILHKSSVKGDSLDVLVVDYNGDFNIYTDSEFNRRVNEEGAAFTDTIMTSLTFGPVLVANGENTHSPKFKTQVLGEVSKVYARACIGQLGELHYLLCTIGQPGCDMEALADLMASRGCVTAYNLDGGQSGTLLYHGTHYNTIAYNKGNTEKYGERYQESIIYFGTAQSFEK